MNFQAEITAAATANGLAPLMVGGLVAVESNFNHWAWNPEQRYRYYWNVRTNRPFRMLTDAEVLSELAPPDFQTLAGDKDQEWWAQSASWGLMQVMGAVAREHGFRGEYLTELADPSANLAIGCEHLARLLRWATGDVQQALAAYNGGKRGNDTRPFRNQLYASKVLNAWDKLK